MTCPHDSDDPLCCPPCQTAAGRRGRVTPARVWSDPFIARYAGVCDGCDRQIVADQRIRAGENGRGYPVYVHDDADCMEQVW
jgi:hypothetical protein